VAADTTDTPEMEQRLRLWLPERVSPRRFRHSLGVMEVVTELAVKWDADPAPLRLAALLHDCARELPGDELLRLAARWGLHVREVDRRCPVLLHGRLAVVIAGLDFGLDDPVALSAVHKHTAGHPQMSLPDKLFFLADHIEPNRSHSWVEELRGLAFTEVDEAVLKAVRLNRAYLESAGGIIDPDTLLLEALLLKKGSP
jgi:predicted HD superfamily hydrolase involved in NAD metabolism